MAFDLVKFNRQVYTATTELVDQQVEAFNAASRGALVLAPSAENRGDFSMEASFKQIANLVRRRDVNNGTGSVTPSRLQQLKKVSVKVAGGTPPIVFEPAQYRWILDSPARAADIIAQQLSKAMIQDMVNVALRGLVAAFTGNSAVTHNITTATTKTPSLSSLTAASAKFGDRASSIAAWVMHSVSMNNLWQNALANSNQLFNFGNVAVREDQFGRVYVVTDSPSLVKMNESTANYSTLGLVTGAALVEPNNDFDATMVDETGKENIQRTYQAEWSYNLGIHGYSWNDTDGGSSPNDTALGTATNWPKLVTSNKDTAGVMLVSE